MNKCGKFCVIIFLHYRDFRIGVFYFASPCIPAVNRATKSNFEPTLRYFQFTDAPLRVVEYLAVTHCLSTDRL